MKQKFFSCLFLGMTLIAALTLSSCGGDDDDLTNNGNNGNYGQNNTGNYGAFNPADYTFVVPTIDFLASYDAVKEEMTKWSGWNLHDEANQKTLVYVNDKGVSIAYTFMNNKFVAYTVTFQSTGTDNIPTSRIITDMENYYGCKLGEINMTGVSTSSTRMRGWAFLGNPYAYEVTDTKLDNSYQVTSYMVTYTK